MAQLDGKIGLVTGGASGIGEATVAAFLREGARVVAVDLQADRLDALSEKVEAQTGSQPSRPTCRRPLRARSAAGAASEKFGVVNVLVNVAGMHDAGISTLDTSDEQWDKTFAVNVGAPFWLAKALVPAMIHPGQRQRSDPLAAVPNPRALSICGHVAPGMPVP